MHFFFFSIVLRILQLLINWNHWSHSGGVFSKMYLSKWALQSNRKLKKSHFRHVLGFVGVGHLMCLTMLFVLKLKEVRTNEDGRLLSLLLSYIRYVGVISCYLCASATNLKEVTVAVCYFLLLSNFGNVNMVCERFLFQEKLRCKRHNIFPQWHHLVHHDL